MWLLFVSCKELQKNHGAHLKYLLVWTGSYCLEGLLWGKSFSHNYHTIGWYTYSADAVHPIHLAFSVSVPVIAHKESYCHGLVQDTLAKKRTYTCLFSYAHSIKYFTGATASSETQGQIVGTRESLNGWKNMAQRKVKNGEKSPWGQCLTRPVPNGRHRSGFWLVPEKHKFSGTNQKPEQRRPFGTGLVRHCSQGLFSPFFTFLGSIHIFPPV